MPKKVIRSFGYAISGVAHGMKERNMRVHVVAALLVLLFSILLSVSITELCLLFLCMGLVLTAELINTAVEHLGNIVAPLHPDAYKKMGVPKDIAAGAVLLSAVFALGVGLMIFLPKIVTLYGQVR